MHCSQVARLAAATLAFAYVPYAHSAPLSYGTYYEDTSFAGCGFVNTGCRLNFGQTPADKLVKLKHVHCNFNSQSPINTAFFYIAATSGGASLGRELPLQFLPSQAGTGAQSDGFFRYTVSMDTEFLIGQGRFPWVNFYISSSATTSMSCVISGELVNPI